MEDTRNCLMNAEIAFANKQYMEALTWYRKVLSATPDDIYVLSRVGALCITMGRSEEAMCCFERALKLDPGNGDNAFNYANACFFCKDNVKAFEMYVKAEQLGCSDDVKPRLYYQMALLCSMRQDIRSALIYFAKCENSDRTGKVSLNPDLISEKLKLYMALQDFAKAETCAAQLVAIDPGAFRNYMVYYSMLMAHKKYDLADKLLADAEQYAQLSEEDRFTLVMQQSALYTAMGDYGKAIQVLEACRRRGGLNNEQLSQLLLAVAEAHSKNGNCDTAIGILAGMLSGSTFAPAVQEQKYRQRPVFDLLPEELDEMFHNDLEIIREKIDFGELDPDISDEEGEADSSMFGAGSPQKVEEPEFRPAEAWQLPGALREKVAFSLLTCYLEKDAFAEARKLADVLKHSQNKYYSYFGIYTSAMTEGKLTGDSEGTRRKYEEALAFFRGKTFADASDVLACIFRARLYAEQGKYHKASEIAGLLSDADRQSILDYIKSCKE